MPRTHQKKLTQTALSSHCHYCRKKILPHQIVEYFTTLNKPKVAHINCSIKQFEKSGPVAGRAPRVQPAMKSAAFKRNGFAS